MSAHEQKSGILSGRFLWTGSRLGWVPNHSPTDVIPFLKIIVGVTEWTVTEGTKHRYWRYPFCSINHSVSLFKHTVSMVSHYVLWMCMPININLYLFDNYVLWHIICINLYITKYDTFSFYHVTKCFQSSIISFAIINVY